MFTTHTVCISTQKMRWRASATHDKENSDNLAKNQIRTVLSLTAMYPNTNQYNPSIHPPHFTLPMPSSSYNPGIAHLAPSCPLRQTRASPSPQSNPYANQGSTPPPLHNAITLHIHISIHSIIVTHPQSWSREPRWPRNLSDNSRDPVRRRKGCMEGIRWMRDSGILCVGWRSFYFILF
jgi:hypothetical protein